MRRVEVDLPNIFDPDHASFAPTTQFNPIGNADNAETYAAAGVTVTHTDDFNTNSGTQNRIETDGTYTYLFDQHGNRTHRFVDADASGTVNAGDTNITTYEWDTRNRLASVTDQDSFGTTTQQVEHIYDLDNRWIGKEVDTDGDGDVDVTERYVYYGNQIIYRFVDEDAVGATGHAEAEADELANRYLWGPAVDQLFAQEDVTDLLNEGNVLWALTDNLGTVRELMDSTVAGIRHVRHATYDAFGNVTDVTNPSDPLVAAVDTIFGFTGKALDEYTGLQQNWHRWYDAETGQWMSPDPIKDDVNTYRYGGNNPTNRIDPLGLSEVDATHRQRIEWSHVEHIGGVAIQGTASCFMVETCTPEKGRRLEMVSGSYDWIADSESDREFVRSMRAIGSIDSSLNKIGRQLEEAATVIAGADARLTFGDEAVLHGISVAKARDLARIDGAVPATNGHARGGGTAISIPFGGTDGQSYRAIWRFVPPGQLRGANENRSWGEFLTRGVFNEGGYYKLIDVLPNHENAAEVLHAVAIQPGLDHALLGGIAGAKAVGIIGGSFIPVVGEIMDVAILIDPDAAWWEKLLAGGSLGLNLATAGFAPNFGAFARTARATSSVDETLSFLARLEKVSDAPSSGVIDSFLRTGGRKGGLVLEPVDIAKLRHELANDGIYLSYGADKFLDTMGQSGKIVHAMHRRQANGRNIIYLRKGADLDDFIHEYMHALDAVQYQSKFARMSPKWREYANFYRLRKSQYWELMTPTEHAAAVRNLEDFGPWKQLPAWIHDPSKLFNPW